MLRNMSLELNTTPDWQSASGTRLDGVYELHELVSADGSSALFRTLLPGDAAPRALARLIHLNAVDIARQRDLWQALARMPHRNLPRIISAGEMESAGKSLAYVVTEGADEDLSTVLRERGLTTEEAGGVLLSVIGALRELHAVGFLHGRVCPAEIFAAGDEIKISIDCVTRAGKEAIAYRGLPAYLAPEEQDRNTTAAADVWCFGASLFEALTQKPFAPAQLEEARKLPAPFGRIVVRCVDPQPGARPGLAEILSLYQGKGLRRTVVGAPQSPIETEHAPSVNATAIQQPRTTRRAPLALVLAALLVLLVVFSVWWTKNRTTPAGQMASPDAKAVTTQDAPAAVPAPPPPATLPPQTSSSVVTKEPEPTFKGPIWRVVLWTYSRQSDAQNKVQELAARYPELHPEVFTPNENGGLYLVVVGGEMTRTQAEDARHRVRQLGLPRDSYIQNFSH